MITVQYVITRPQRIRLYLIFKFFSSELKLIFLWFPWHSFLTFVNVYAFLFVITLLNINNSDNNYYSILYAIFLIFLFSSLLVFMDLDIFAGLLLLIESVVILMFFFLVIYLNPNILNNVKYQKWQIYVFSFIFITLLIIYVPLNLGEYFYAPFFADFYVFEEFYEALVDLVANDLVGPFINLFWVNSLIMIFIGILLLGASIVCTFLVSFFIKPRVFNLKSFLSVFSILNECHSFIFNRKQNLSKQGRNESGARVFNKKNFDSKLHKEYKYKYDIFEQKKKDKEKKQ